MNKTSTCCFLGDRKLPGRKIGHVVLRLDQEVESLIKQGVTTFISGGMPGFDQVAASLIVAKKGMGKKIRLIFVIAYKNQNELWSPGYRNFYNILLGEADEIIYMSEEFHRGCLKKRNRFMIAQSAYCICAHCFYSAGTVQAIGYVRNKGLKVINVVG